MKKVLKYVLSGVVLFSVFGVIGMGLFGNIIGQIIGIVAVLVGLSIMMNIDQKN